MGSATGVTNVEFTPVGFPVKRMAGQGSAEAGWGSLQPGQLIP
jgi:hypothetical protein